MMLNKIFKITDLKDSDHALDISIYLYNFLFHFHSGLLLFYAPLWGSSVLQTSSTSQAYIYIFVLLASSVITKPLGALLLIFKRVRNNQALAFKITAFMQLVSAACLVLSWEITSFQMIPFLVAKFLQGAALGCENSMVRVIFTRNHNRYIQRLVMYEIMCILSYMVSSFYLYHNDHVLLMLLFYLIFSAFICIHRLFIFQDDKFTDSCFHKKKINPHKIQTAWYGKIIAFFYVAGLQLLNQLTFFFPFVLCQMYNSFVNIYSLSPLQEKIATVLLFLWDLICLIFISNYINYKKMMYLFYAGMIGFMLCVVGYSYINSYISYAYIFTLQMITILTGLCVMLPQMQWGFDALNRHVSQRFLPFSQGAIIHLSAGLLGRLLPLFAVISIEKGASLRLISFISFFIVFFILLCNKIYKF